MAGGENDAWASTIFKSSALVQHGCKRRPYRLLARALSSLEVTYSNIRNSKDDKQVCNRRLSSATIMTPFCQRWSHNFGSWAPSFLVCIEKIGETGDEARHLLHDIQCTATVKVPINSNMGLSEIVFA